MYSHAPASPLAEIEAFQSGMSYAIDTVSMELIAVSNDSYHGSQRREIVFEIEVDKNIPPIHHGTVETG